MTPGSIKIVLQDGTRAIKEMNTFVIASCHQVLESPLIHAHAQTLIIIFSPMPTGREFTVYGNQDCQVLHISFNTHFK